MLSTIETVNNVVNNFIWGVPAIYFVNSFATSFLKKILCRDFF